jgi:hypothetical protein
MHHNSQFVLTRKQSKPPDIIPEVAKSTGASSLADPTQPYQTLLLDNKGTSDED